MGKLIEVIPVGHQRQGTVDTQKWPAGTYVLRPMVADASSGTMGNKKGAPRGRL